MIKLTKYLKPFVFSILLAIGLLYAQAMTDLALPDYMSEIVNTGIQNNGIENAIPEVIKEADFAVLQSFMTEEDALLFEESYSFISSEDKEYKDFDEDYSALEASSVYVYDQANKEDEDQLELAISKAMIAISSKMDGPQIDPSTLDDTLIVQMGNKAVTAYMSSLGADLETMQRNYILKTGGIMLLVSLLGAIASIAVGLIAARVASGLGRNLRTSIFKKVQSFSNSEFDTFSTASLITRSTNDITQIQTLMVMMIRMLFYAPIMGFGGVVKALEKSSSMSWIIAVAVLILLGVIMIVFAIALPKFKAVQKLIDKLNLVVRENLSGMMVIRAFNTQKFEEQRFEKANAELTSTNLYVNRIMTFLFPVMMLIMNGVTLLIVWIGAHQIADSSMQVGDMMAFMQYAIQIIMSFLMLSRMFIMVPRASVSAGRISEVLETEATILDPENPKSINPEGKGLLEFKNVSFRYPLAEEDMLKDISFKAEAGKVTAIIGSTGAGKTTLVNLIPRFYDISGGSILIDGVSIKEVKQSDLRNVIGYVPQKASLFSGSIASNLKLGDKNATETDMNLAIQIAQATDFVSEKPDGLNENIAQGGANVSGGQKQRLSIARALIKKPKVYIFDDSFSALDYKTDAALRNALKTQTDNATVILVAQRISTIKTADQILVLDEGKLVGVGTHKELLEHCDTYKEIAMSQLSKEELS